MTVSVRSYLIAGAAAATATTIALTPVQVTPADVAVPAHPTSAQPQLTQAMVELLAAASRMTAAVPAPPKPAPVPGSAPVTGAAPALAAPNAVVVGPQNAASDWLTQAYTSIQAWVDWGVNYGVDIAYWLAGWGVPFAGTIGAQTDIIYFQLIKPISDNIFYQLVVPVVNDPLNIFTWTNGIANTIGASVNTLINFGIAEFNYFFGWILPPLPPRPPWPLAATAEATTLSPTAPTQTLATVLTGAGETLANAVKGLATGVSLLNPADGQLKVEPTAGVDEASAVTGNPVQTVVADIEDATSGAADLVKSATGDLKDSLQNAAENAAEALPGPTTTTPTDEVTTVPTPVQQSLQSQKPATTDKSVSSTSRQTRIKDVGDGVRNATADIKSSVQKATAGLRNAVKGAAKAADDSKTKVNKADKPSKDKSDNSGGE